MKNPDFLFPSVVFLAASALPFSVSAGEKRTDLPGVKGDYRIVQPAPVPDTVEAQSPYGPGFVKVGDTYVKISGRVRYDVDFSTRKDYGKKRK